MKNATFLMKKVTHPKLVVDFFVKTHPANKKIMEIVEDFFEKSYNNNGNSWKS